MSSASQDTRLESQGPVLSGPDPVSTVRVDAPAKSDWNNPRLARNLFLWPALIVVLILAIFPLIASLVLALSKVSLVKGGFKIDFVGLTNFRTLFLGSERTHVLGQAGTPTLFGWLVFLGGTALLLVAFVRTVRSRKIRPLGLIGRAVGGLLLVLLLWSVATTVLGSGGRPGTLMVTIVYAFSGTLLTYLLGLGLAVLTTQRLRGQRFFRIVFLVPLMITPVGVAYMFRMLTDTEKGPITPLWRAAGLSDFTLLGDPWGARLAVIISDVWQWTPFMFIVLLAALEGRDLETEEAATVDGASKARIFLNITMPALIPVSATVILIRLIEAFKIIDLPNVLTNGGPGTATESLTLQSFISWRGFDLGSSAAIAYTLLVVVTMVGIGYATFIIRRTHSMV